MVLDSDAPEYGGHGRLQPKQTHFTMIVGSKTRKQHTLSLYLPARSAFVLCPATEGS
jgi:1,4-alpha-glucan branching enzyme